MRLFVLSRALDSLGFESVDEWKSIYNMANKQAKINMLSQLNYVAEELYK
ncbi:MAG: hypothetical protein NZZ41_02835 [Candidatus Dojkabacteria bacterium]|nr:hypothetical protein [Candidatus Dojkabacteria bacterium]